MPKKCVDKWHRTGAIYIAGNLLAIKAHTPWWFQRKVCPFCLRPFLLGIFCKQQDA